MANLATFTGPGNIIHFFIDDLVFPNEASPGVVDRIRIYDAALNPAQVLDIFNGGTGGTTDRAPAGAPTRFPGCAPYARRDFGRSAAPGAADAVRARSRLTQLATGSRDVHAPDHGNALTARTPRVKRRPSPNACCRGERAP